nr:sugar phosphate isomerase/epimerase family protein [Mangrovicoccus sp. HB161399]
MAAREIAAHRDWLFDGGRDLELQDFRGHAALRDWKETAAQIRPLLDGHRGRRGIHGPFEGLDIANPDPELRPLITARFLDAVAACEAVGGSQMVLHSPYDAWYRNNLHLRPRYAEAKAECIHAVLDPVVRRAEEAGVTLVLENIEDVDPASRRALAESFASPAVRLSVDTGHAHLARRMSGAPPADYFIRDAGAMLAHVHLQDLDGHADRHWPPGDGEIAWPAVFAAIADAPSAPHAVLELRDKSQIPRGFAWLAAQGLAE